MIFWLFGFPGSGKDYCAQQLAKLANAEYVHIDDFLTPKDKEKLLHKKFSPDDRIQKLIRASRQINKMLATKKHVVAADSLPDHKSREFLKKEFGEKILFILVKIDPKIHKERIHKRKDHFFTEDLLADYIKKNWQEPIRVPHEVIDNTTQGKKEITKKLEEIIKSQI